MTPQNFDCRFLLLSDDEGFICLSCRNPLAQLEEEKREHDNKIKKLEIDMEQVFEMKVKEKKQKLKDLESDVSIETG